MYIVPAAPALAPPGFGYGAPSGRTTLLPGFSRMPGVGFAIPLWIPASLAGIAAIVFRYRRRVPPGHCEKCRYDLTGHLSGACPECGIARPRHRLRRRMKWAGTLGCATIATLFVSSIFCSVVFCGLDRVYVIAHGCAKIITSDYPYRTVGVRIRKTSRMVRKYWYRMYFVWPSIQHQSTGRMGIISVPLWMPFAAIAVPTCFFWQRDRRYRRRERGVCIACGYDLTGNTSGVCPGCETEIVLPEK